MANYPIYQQAYGLYGAVAPPLPALATPTGSQATATSSSSLSVTASSVQNAAGYQLYTAATQAGAYAKLGGVLTTPTYNHTGLSAAQTQWYKWQAVGDGVNYRDSALTAAFSGTTSPAQTTPGIASITPNVGPAGTAVTIDGLGFGASQGAGEVRFNGVLATATSWSDTRIIATAPSGQATGKLTVQTNAGTTYTSPGNYVLTTNAPFNLTSGSFGEAQPAVRYRDLVAQEAPYNHRAPAKVTAPGSAVTQFTTAFSQPYTPTLPFFGGKIHLLKTFGSGSQSLVRFFFAMSNGERIGGQFNGLTGEFHLYIRQDNGAEQLLTDRSAAGIPVLPEFDLGISVAGCSLTMWLRTETDKSEPNAPIPFASTANEWQVWSHQLLDGNAAYDYRLPAKLATITDFVVQVGSGSNAGTTLEFDKVEWGALHGVGIANHAPVTDSLGAFYEGNGYLLNGCSIAMASAAPNRSDVGIEACTGGLLVVNTATGAIETRARLCVSREVQGVVRLIGENSYSFVWDVTRSLWTCIASTWGTSVSAPTGVEPILYEMADLPRGEQVLYNGVRLYLPRPNGGFANDTDHKFFGGLWHMVYTTNNAGIFRVHHATAPRLPTASDTPAQAAALWTLVASTAGGTAITEGNKLIFNNGAWYIASTYAPVEPNSVATVKIFNLNLSEVGSVVRTDLAQSQSPTHFSYYATQANNVTNYGWLAFDDYKYDNALYSWGKLHFLISTEQKTGAYDFVNHPVPA